MRRARQRRHVDDLAAVALARAPSAAMRDVLRYDAYVALLALPDPIDLPARTRRYTCAGDPHRKERLKLEFERAYLRHRKADYGTERAEIVSVRRSPLHLAWKRA